MKKITLITDFGEFDSYVGTIKGVILNICPQAHIIDISHNIKPQDISHANWILKQTYKYYPKGTTHVCIVDPGVGSTRKPILIETKNYFFIGPNNGIFTCVTETEEITNIIELTEKKYWLSETSQTFHGRDIFSPTAAHLAAGIKAKNFGSPLHINHLTKLPIRSLSLKKNALEGQIQYIDHFGNIITNIPESKLRKECIVKVNGFNLGGLVKSYSEAKGNLLTAIKGSHGYLELFIFKGNAAKAIKAKIGDKVRINF